jgi:hypothetical protein
MAQFDALPVGHPLFFRGPEGKMSVLHTKMGPGTISRCAEVVGEELPKWGFPDKIEPGQEYPHWSSKLPYTATSDVGEGTTRKVTLFFIGPVDPARLPMFSLDPLPAVG